MMVEVRAPCRIQRAMATLRGHLPISEGSLLDRQLIWVNRQELDRCVASSIRVLEGATCRELL